MLDQCTVRLGLASAARRLYTLRGELITDVQQLVRPYVTTAEPKNNMETQQNEVNSDSGPDQVSAIVPLLYLNSYLLKFILQIEHILSFIMRRLLNKVTFMNLLVQWIQPPPPPFYGQFDWFPLYPQSWNVSLRKIFIAIVLVQTQIVYPLKMILLLGKARCAFHLCSVNLSRTNVGWSKGKCYTIWQPLCVFCLTTRPQQNNQGCYPSQFSFLAAEKFFFSKFCFSLDPRRTSCA